MALFEIGTVLRLYVEDTNPPKVKYCIIVGNCSAEIATVFINTETKPEYLPSGLRATQLPISPSELSCLDHDSYIDCSEIRPRDKKELNELLQREPGRKEGSLSSRKIEDVVRVVKNADTISTEDKKKFNLV